MSTSELEITTTVSDNTKATLLLTAPLIVGRGESSKELLTASEYGKLARFLYQNECQPADLIATSGSDLVVAAGRIVNSDRIKRLIDRGFLLSQVLERWQARAIWVVSRPDENYPTRLKERLMAEASRQGRRFRKTFSAHPISLHKELKTLLGSLKSPRPRR